MRQIAFGGRALLVTAALEKEGRGTGRGGEDGKGGRNGRE